MLLTTASEVLHSVQEVQRLVNEQDVTSAEQLQKGIVTQISSAGGRVDYVKVCTLCGHASYDSIPVIVSKLAGTWDLLRRWFMLSHCGRCRTLLTSRQSLRWLHFLARSD